MMNEGIELGTYVECQDTILISLKLYFLRQNFKNYERYNKMRPVANQLTKLFTAAKTSNNIEV